MKTPCIPTIYSYYDDSLPYGGETIYVIYDENEDGSPKLWDETKKDWAESKGLVSKSWGYWWADANTGSQPYSEAFDYLEEALLALVRECT